MPEQLRCEVFIGSSSEGRETARALQADLSADHEVVMWDQGVFEPGGYTLDSLINQARRSDFAVLVATADDVRESRGETAAVPRDNVILEFGLFAGVLGRERTFVLPTLQVKLPTDTLGLTTLTYRDQKSEPAAVAMAATQVRGRIKKLGQRHSGVEGRIPSEAKALADELAKLRENLIAQGWALRADNRTVLRVASPSGKAYTLTKSTPGATREALRPFVAKLRSGGLRVSEALRRPTLESPFS